MDVIGSSTTTSIEGKATTELSAETSEIDFPNTTQCVQSETDIQFS